MDLKTVAKEALMRLVLTKAEKYIDKAFAELERGIERLSPDVRKIIERIAEKASKCRNLICK